MLLPAYEVAHSTVPHSAIVDCFDHHCWAHDVDEPPRAGDHSVCGECFHIFRTADELLAANADRTRELQNALELTTPLYPATDPAQVFACPFCSHDL